MNGPKDIDRTLLDFLRHLEKSQKLERAFLLRVAGKGFQDIKNEVNILCKDCKLFEDIMDHPHPIVINDLSSMKEVQKDLTRFFNVKVYNIMMLPIVQKRGG